MKRLTFIADRPSIRAGRHFAGRRRPWLFVRLISWGIVVGIAVYITLELMKQYIDGLPLRDDSCGPIGWHLLDDKGVVASDLE
jgi:hypothetical protein